MNSYLFYFDYNARRYSLIQSENHRGITYII